MENQREILEKRRRENSQELLSHQMCLNPEVKDGIKNKVEKITNSSQHKTRRNLDT